MGLRCGADRGAGVNFQVTVLKILAAYPDGFAVLHDLKRDMAILATSGREWADRTRRLAARVPDLDIFPQGLVERINGGWKITARGRTVLDLMEAPPAAPESAPEASVDETFAITQTEPVPQLRRPADRAKRRRERRREARERARATAS